MRVHVRSSCVTASHLMSAENSLSHLSSTWTLHLPHTVVGTCHWKATSGRSGVYKWMQWANQNTADEFLHTLHASTSVFTVCKHYTDGVQGIKCWLRLWTVTLIKCDLTAQTKTELHFRFITRMHTPTSLCNNCNHIYWERGKKLWLHDVHHLVKCLTWLNTTKAPADCWQTDD